MTGDRSTSDFLFLIFRVHIIFSPRLNGSNRRETPRVQGTPSLYEMSTGQALFEALCLLVPSELGCEAHWKDSSSGAWRSLALRREIEALAGLEFEVTFSAGTKALGMGFSGIRIVNVFPGLPAEAKGVQVGMRFVRVNGVRVPTRTKLLSNMIVRAQRQGAYSGPTKAITITFRRPTMREIKTDAQLTSAGITSAAAAIMGRASESTGAPCPAPRAGDTGRILQAEVKLLRAKLKNEQDARRAEAKQALIYKRLASEQVQRVERERDALRAQVEALSRAASAPSKPTVTKTQTPPRSSLDDSSDELSLFVELESAKLAAARANESMKAAQARAKRLENELREAKAQISAHGVDQTGAVSQRGATARGSENAQPRNAKPVFRKSTAKALMLYSHCTGPRGKSHQSRMRHLFRASGIQLYEAEGATQVDLRRRLTLLSGRTTYPQVFVHNKQSATEKYQFIGGFDEIMELNEYGEFQDAFRSCERVTDADKSSRGSIRRQVTPRQVTPLSTASARSCR